MHVCMGVDMVWIVEAPAVNDMVGQGGTGGTESTTLARRPQARARARVVKKVVVIARVVIEGKRTLIAKRVMQHEADKVCVLNVISG